MSTHKLRYPYTWGRGIVNDLVEKMPRGTENLRILLEIPANDMRHLLVLTLCSGNSMRWEVVRKIIKYLNSEETVIMRRFSAKERKELYKCIRFMCEDCVLDEKIARDTLDMCRQNDLGL